ncbi:sugar ABC transporter permease [Rhodovarius crocodyli]|uniref:Sugar ABC transporter permease n=1 Tax=Rhodovarius crocodyli TaxID=1979269 RepID=A0A437M2R9_9PROT|nr:sugar ABC transporter permease [Rhodovarius crocodyli]RVT92001.1 sugar ABC transporter permease [Rhodovarius crocodyli]
MSDLALAAPLSRPLPKGILLAGPAALLMLLLQIGPLVLVVCAAFTDWQLGGEAPNFVGLDNFRALIADHDFQASVLVTARYTLMVVPGALLLGLGLAMLLQGARRGRTVYQTIFFLPYIATLAAMSIAWQMLLHPSFGPVNQGLAALGLPVANWLRDENTALPVLALIGIWHETGFAMVFFLAALTSVPTELHDAARIDGLGGGWDRFWLVTAPHIAPIALFVLVVLTAHAVMVFDTVALLTQGGPGNATRVLLFVIYQEGFSFFRTNVAATATVFFLAITLTLGMLQLRLGRRGGAA